ncbi:unnamed protein product [Penicillium camemberti]|uniref:Str. FM013 n=1 Tax=Penicillium camemberti (strain FM 013) TaxID=1429867 RepID=A0A0G4P3F2_PENC3|nr:unnamed protein product [Penicillium camemberti]
MKNMFCEEDVLCRFIREYHNKKKKVDNTVYPYIYSIFYGPRYRMFAVLKHSYGRLVETKIHLGINYIDKLDFLEAYPSGSELSRNFTPKAPLPANNCVDNIYQYKALLRIGSRSPLSPSDRTFNQLIKGLPLAIQGNIILAKENSELRASNEKQKQNGSRPGSQIAFRGHRS